MGILSAMTKAIQHEFTYNPRDEMGTQDPATTLKPVEAPAGITRC